MFALSATGAVLRTPPPRTAWYSRPVFTSTMVATSTAPIVGSPWASGAAATETQADSRPAMAGRVPSMGSTTSTCSAPGGATRPRSSL